MKKKGFTLIELLIVIAILSVLAGIISFTFITSLQRGRDARRKADLKSIQTALELYYEDVHSFPLSITSGSALTHPTITDKIYMQKVPSDPISGDIYLYQSDGTYYKLYSCIENQNDSGPGVKSYVGTNCQISSGTTPTCNPCRFAVSSSNTTP